MRWHEKVLQSLAKCVQCKKCNINKQEIPKHIHSATECKGEKMEKNVH
jgi:hypothetical protein